MDILRDGKSKMGIPKWKYDMVLNIREKNQSGSKNYH